MINKKVVIAICGCVALAGAIGYQSWVAKQKRKVPMAMPVVSVQVASAVPSDVPMVVTALGMVKASETVAVTSRVEGHLVELGFKEGALVEKGQLIAKLDTRPYEAVLAQHQGTLQQNKAQLKNATSILDRYKKLIKTKAVSEQTLSTQEAQVNQYAGAVRVAEAQIRTAKLNIEYATIKAPISGRVGLKGYDVGNLVTPNSSTPIVTISKMDPANVIFNVPQSYASKLRSKMNEGERLPVKAIDQGTNRVVSFGKVVAIDNFIDQETGTIRVKAELRNEKSQLFTNQSVTIHLVTDILKDAITVPDTAVQTSTQGRFVFVLQEDGTVKKVSVRVGESAPDNRLIIAKGLKTGDKVVTSGVSNLADGVKVAVVEPKEVDMSVLNRPRKRGGFAARRAKSSGEGQNGAANGGRNKQ